MNRLLTSVILLLIYAPFSVAQTVVQVRAGEHDIYTRIVIPVPKEQIWELRTRARQVTLTLRQTQSEFDISSVFNRIPKTRLLNLTQKTADEDTSFLLSLGCDCTTEAKVGDGHLIIDINESSKAALPSINIEREMLFGGVETGVPTVPVPEGESDTKTELTDKSGSEVVSDGNSETPPLSRADSMQPQTGDGTDREMNDAPSLPNESAARSANLNPSEANIDDLEALLSRFDRVIAKETSSDAVGNGVRIKTPEGFRERQDDSNENFQYSSRQKAENDEPPADCVGDEQLDISNWYDGTSFNKEISRLQSSLYGEFDNKSSEVAIKLAKLYIYFGLGVEAKALLSDEDQAHDRVKLLIEMANIVENEPFEQDGILHSSSHCAGNIQMWRTAAVISDETQPIPRPIDAIERFSALPVEIRKILGPRLVSSFLNRDQLEEAKLVFDILDRASGHHGEYHDLSLAKILLTDGHFEEAEEVLWALIRSNTSVTHEAATLLTNAYITHDREPPKQLIETMEEIVFQNRSSPNRLSFSILEARARFSSGELGKALEIIDRLMREGTDSTAFASDLNDILSSTEDVAVGEYSTAITSHLDLLNSDQIYLDTKNKIARRLLDIGLPSLAFSLLRDEVDANSEGSIIIAAAALIRMDRPQDALNLASQIAPRDATTIEANAYMKLRDNQSAYKKRTELGDVNSTVDAAWRSENWDKATESTSSGVRQLSRFLLNKKNTSTSSTTTEREGDQIAIAQLPLSTTNASLASFGELINQSEAVRNFVASEIELTPEN